MDLIKITVDENGIVSVHDVSGAGLPPITVDTAAHVSRTKARMKVGRAVHAQLIRIDNALAF